jgi:hypothetical protein
VVPISADMEFLSIESHAKILPHIFVESIPGQRLYNNFHQVFCRIDPRAKIAGLFLSGFLSISLQRLKAIYISFLYNRSLRKYYTAILSFVESIPEQRLYLHTVTNLYQFFVK